MSFLQQVAVEVQRAVKIPHAERDVGETSRCHTIPPSLICLLGSLLTPCQNYGRESMDGRASPSKMVRDSRSEQRGHLGYKLFAFRGSGVFLVAEIVLLDNMSLRIYGLRT